MVNNGYSLQVFNKKVWNTKNNNPSQFKNIRKMF